VLTIKAFTPWSGSITSGMVLKSKQVGNKLKRTEKLILNVLSFLS
jgi:hypothetical protein